MSGGKRHPKSARVGRQGVALVDSIVSKMGHIWREKSVSDVGVDGEIELVDIATDQATGRLLMVQIKSRTALAVRSDSTFRLTCSQDDVEYWMSGTAPVLLILVAPDTGEAWFKNLDNWFSDQKQRRDRVVVFDRQADRFDASVSQCLLDWGVPASSGLYLRPPPRSEVLVSNLLRVDHMAPSINVVRSAATGWAAINARLRRAGHSTVDDLVWRGNELWSFRRFDEPPLDVLADGTPERIATDELVDSKSDDDHRLLVRLLNNTLREVTRDQLLFEKKHGYLYFPASKKLRPYSVKWTRSGSGRTVFDAYKDKATDTKVVYYRHYALQFQFLHLDDRWFLALNPTYHYTVDGDRKSSYGAEYLQTIKRLEGHDAVRNLVKFWAGYLQSKHHLFARPDQRLQFGRLGEFDVDHGIDDAYWKSTQRGSESIEAGQATLGLEGM